MKNNLWINRYLPVHSARKFSHVLGQRSLNSSNTRRPTECPLNSMSKKQRVRETSSPRACFNIENASFAYVCSNSKFGFLNLYIILNASYSLSIWKLFIYDWQKQIWFTRVYICAYIYIYTSMMFDMQIFWYPRLMQYEETRCLSVFALLWVIWGHFIIQEW